MWPSCAAEATRLVRRPGTWLLLAVAVALSLAFTYLAPYAAYAGGTDGGSGSTDGGLGGRGLDALLPDQLVGNSISGLPVFIGSIALILAVLTVGGEYAWGTWKTLLTQGPSRSSVYLGKLLVLAAATLVLVLTLFAVGAVASLSIAVAEAQPVHWPSAGDLAVGIGAGWLISAVWAGFGVLLAVLLRGVALPIGLGLVWLLAVQNLLAAVAAPILDWVAQLQKGLPGPNAGSLAAALGATADTPGIDVVVGAGQATLTLVGYLLGFVVLAGAYLHRRDIL